MSKERSEKRQIKLLPVAANAALIVLELVGTAISFRSGGAKNLKYYTVLSNVFALVSSIAFLCSYLRRGGKVSHIAGMMRYIASCCLALTFLTVIFVLVPMAIPYGTAANVLYKGAQIFHHIICPILSCVSFIFFEQDIELPKKAYITAVAPTLTYAAVFVILNLLKAVRGPYPFLHIYEQPVYISVLWFMILGGTALGAAALISRLRKKFSKAS